MRMAESCCNVSSRHNKVEVGSTTLLFKELECPRLLLRFNIAHKISEDIWKLHARLLNTRNSQKNMHSSLVKLLETTY